MRQPVFLTLAEVIEIHTDQIQRYGGREGIRDIGLLSSAVAMPHASFSDQFLHADIFEMAAAYAFHLSQNHPFIDGNKRTALASALVFLEMNGNIVDDPTGALFDGMISLATGKLGKSEFAQILRVLKSERGA
jgi:death-on-curing protein